MTAPDRDPLAAVLEDLDDALSLATRLKTESVYIGWMTAEDARALRAALAPRPPETAARTLNDIADDIEAGSSFRLEDGKVTSRSPETADAGALDAAWAEAETTAKTRGGMLYEVKRRWEGGVKDGWCAMAVKNGIFWRECGDTAPEALMALSVSMGGPGIPSQHDLMPRAAESPTPEPK